MTACIGSNSYFQEGSDYWGLLSGSESRERPKRGPPQMFRNPQMCVTGFRAIRFRGSRNHGILEVSGKRGVVKAVKALIERVRSPKP